MALMGWRRWDVVAASDPYNKSDGEGAARWRCSSAINWLKREGMTPRDPAIFARKGTNGF